MTKLVTKVAKLKEEKEYLQDQIYQLRRTLEDVKTKNKREEEDIKHMIKMAEEANEIKYQKRAMTNDKEKWEGIETVKDKYRDKLEVRLQKEVEGIKEMYSQILERLPNINGKLTGKL